MREISLDEAQGLLPRAAVSSKSTSPLQPASFEQMLKQSLKDVDQLQIDADKTVQALATGQEQDIHNTMIAMEKADIAFRLLMQVRNKVISAYETIMRMAV